MIKGTNIDVKTLSANEILLNGVSLNGTNGSKLNIDENGNVEIAGNINMLGGSISWSNISDKPIIPSTASDVGALPAGTTASDIGALPTNSPKLTHITSNGVYTGELVGNEIRSEDTYGQINGVRITGGTWGDLELWDSGTLKAKLYNDMGSPTTKLVAVSGKELQIGSTESGINGKIVLRGNIEFASNANVTGLNTVAVFG
ncbi:hypothetical protein [Schinkia azotoformans]|uniref:hypothetical protein n=1 Tax=Schinkia azotoformans TaxID=1454 RepID=UPI002DB93A19|nr:hypothetical protein [Schinkia azotoformans]MEC1697766.1 hypothetical protein [Schinkia azotoformans]